MTPILPRCANIRQGFSILEVMIAIAILATALSIVGGTMYTMQQGRTAMDEEIKVQAIAQVMTERLQGARWDDLGKDVSTYVGRNAWSWHRRATKQLVYAPTMDPTITPPMQEKAARKVDDLIEQGIITDPSGVRNLKVYLEYYQMKLTESLNTRLVNDPTLDPRQVWMETVGDPIRGIPPSGPDKDDNGIFLQEDPTVLNLSLLDPAVVMRVLISWESCLGGTRWHEVIIARRR